MNKSIIFLLLLCQLHCTNQKDSKELKDTSFSIPKTELQSKDTIERNSISINEVERLVGNVFSSKVVSIQDGDTIELRLVYTGKKARDRRNKNLRIRFAHIDTPERGKPFYKVASQFTANHCFGEIVTIVHDNEFDRYGRLIGEVILPDGRNLNKMLVKAGLALHFKKYSTSEEYALLEKKAINEEKGIWGI